MSRLTGKVPVSRVFSCSLTVQGSCLSDTAEKGPAVSTASLSSLPCFSLDADAAAEKGRSWSVNVDPPSQAQSEDGSKHTQMPISPRARV